jgi:Bacterial Ig-like domain (group 3)
MRAGRQDRFNLTGISSLGRDAAALGWPLGSVRPWVGLGSCCVALLVSDWRRIMCTGSADRVHPPGSSTRRRGLLLILLTVLLAAWFTSPASASVATWSLSEDTQANALSTRPADPFADSYGHAGVWELMLSASTARDPSTYSDMTFVPSSCYPPGVYLWNQGTSESPWGGAVVNTTDATAQTPCAPSQVLPPHRVFVHPGPANDALVAWHSPISGTVSVTGGIVDADCGAGDGVAWYIDKGSVDVASGAINNCGKQRFPSGLTLQVTRGATLYFLIEPKADYGWDLTQINLTIQQVRQTATVLSCSPSTVAVGQSTTCTAQVFDIDRGLPITPTGKITFATNRAGSFSSARCSLTGSSTNASCTVSYTTLGIGRGEHALTASYSGDSNHLASSGQTIVAVTAARWSLSQGIEASALSATPLNPFPDSYGHPGVWELMLSAGTARDPSTYSDLTFVGQVPCNPAGVVAWTQAPGSDLVGVAEVNTTDTTLYGLPCAPTAVERPHEAFLHPGPSDDVLVAWHSPLAGTVSVTGRIVDADCGGGDGVAWYIEQGSVDVASGAIKNCGKQRFPSGLTLHVARGTTLYFVIDPKANYGWDLTEVDVAIRLG